MRMHTKSSHLRKSKPFLLQSLFLLTFLPASFAFCNSNVLTNPGFEDGITGWSARNCSISAVSSPVHAGSGAARAYNRNATWQGIKQDMLNKMVIGETYAVSGWVRTSTSASSTVYITFQKTDSGNNGNPRYQQAASGTANNSGWTYISGNYTLNVTGTLTELLVYVEGPDAEIDLYVDDMRVYGPEIVIDNTANGTIDVNTRHQTIEGFGAAGAWYEGTLVALGQSHPEIYDVLFGDLGLDIYRLRNAYNQNGGTDYMNRSAAIIANAEASLGRPLKILISCWSPPASLKSNGETANGGTLAGGPSNYVYDDFADWWADSITAWAGYGITADYISIQNEPDWSAIWDTCRFEPEETSSYAGYDQAFEAVYDELYARFGTAMPKMIGPETTGLNGAAGSTPDDYISAMDDLSHVYGYAHHLYNINAGDDPDSYLPSMQSFNNAWGSKPLFQTEYEKAVGGWPDALNMALLLHYSLTVEEVSSYLYWDLFWGKPDSIPGFVHITTSSYSIDNDYYGFKHFSKFINADWQRVDTDCDNPNLKLSAYISPTNQQLTAVMVNIAAADIETSLSFNGFSIDSGSIYRTTSSQNCALIGSYNTAAPLIIPAGSIVTLSLISDTVDTDPPAAPANLSAAPAGSLVVLEWNDNTETDLAGYNIYRSTTAGAGYTKINTAVISEARYIDTTATAGAPHYYVVTAVDTSSNESNNSNEANATPVETGIGTILRQWWTGITGTAVSNLTSSANYPDNPTGSNYLASFEAPTDWENSYGTRIHGWLHPVITGSYTFWIAGDDNCELWLSTDGNPADAALIAEVPGWTNSRIWDKYPEQQSDPVQLTAGQKYYIRALHKEGTGGDNLAVAWSGPGLSQQVIDGMYLSPWPAAPYGDFEPDNDVDIHDLAALFALWLEDDCFTTAGIDLDGDCLIDLYEFSALSQNWGL